MTDAAKTFNAVKISTVAFTPAYVKKYISLCKAFIRASVISVLM